MHPNQNGCRLVEEVRRSPQHAMSKRSRPRPCAADRARARRQRQPPRRQPAQPWEPRHRGRASAPAACPAPSSVRVLTGFVPRPGPPVRARRSTSASRRPTSSAPASTSASASAPPNTATVASRRFGAPPPDHPAAPWVSEVHHSQAELDDVARLEPPLELGEWHGRRTRACWVHDGDLRPFGP